MRTHFSVLALLMAGSVPARVPCRTADAALIEAGLADLPAGDTRERRAAAGHPRWRNDRRWPGRRLRALSPAQRHGPHGRRGPGAADHRPRAVRQARSSPPTAARRAAPRAWSSRTGRFKTRSPYTDGDPGAGDAHRRVAEPAIASST
ncbi:MAG: hypothetical protein MZW92_76350 [Comamonadaceae bacterium]|nr:hypothetical protein [Comamonadaceae bacterium]